MARITICPGWLHPSWLRQPAYSSQLHTGSNVAQHANTHALVSIHCGHCHTHLVTQSIACAAETLQAARAGHLAVVQSTTLNRSADAW